MTKHDAIFLAGRQALYEITCLFCDDPLENFLFILSQAGSHEDGSP